MITLSAFFSVHCGIVTPICLAVLSGLLRKMGAGDWLNGNRISTQPLQRGGDVEALKHELA